MLSYNDALSHLLYGKDVSELSADDRMLIANIVTLAGAAAGGAVDGSAEVSSETLLVELRLRITI
ncbi:MAG: VENN motif pre-toxin domain-containing protein [Pantoea vagans]|nr:VENN motif pre-toxin domain-containing protein [Pantoea vagans]